MDSGQEKKRKLIKGFILLGLFFSFIFTWSIVKSTGDNELLVAFLDVGQGDSIYIEAPNGNQLLVDGGSNKQVLRELSEVMPYYDRSIDVLLATHPDGDHIGGLIGVLESYEVESVIESGVVSDTNVNKVFQERVKKEGAEHIFARRGMNIVLDGESEVYLTVLFPDYADVSNWDSNAASVVAKLTYGETSFLLTGDSPKEIEEYLVSLDGRNLDVDVLKLGHHGSRTSSSASFLSAASPTYAVISAGKDNRYGHPHRDVLQSLSALGISYLGTYENGTIKFHSDGEKIWIK